MDESSDPTRDAIREVLEAHVRLGEIRSEVAQLRADLTGERTQLRDAIARMEVSLVRVSDALSALAAAQAAMAKVETQLAERAEARAKVSAAQWERWATPIALVGYAVYQVIRGVVKP